MGGVSLETRSPICSTSFRPWTGIVRQPAGPTVGLNGNVKLLPSFRFQSFISPCINRNGSLF